jgi:hypothetical protein
MSETRAASFLQTISHVLVVGAGVLYLFGFIVVSIYDASYGIADFNLFRTKVIGAGCLFVLLSALPVVLTFRSFRIFGLGRPPGLGTRRVRPENEQYLFAEIAASFPFVCLGLTSMLQYLYVTPLSWSGSWGSLLVVLSMAYFVNTVYGFKKFDIHPVRCLASSLVLLAGLVVVLLRLSDRGTFWFVAWLSSVFFVTMAAWFSMRNPEEIRTTEWERYFLLFIPLILGIYSVRLYPRIKPQYGGGAPVPIVLHLTKKLPVFESENPSVSLIDETEQGYYVLHSSDKAMFVARGLVEEVEFLRSAPVTTTNTKKP